MKESCRGPELRREVAQVVDMTTVGDSAQWFDRDACRAAPFGTWAACRQSGHCRGRGGRRRRRPGHAQQPLLVRNPCPHSQTSESPQVCGVCGSVTFTPGVLGGNLAAS